MTRSMFEFGIAHAPLQLPGDHQIGVLAGNAASPAARRVDRRDDLLVDRAGQHHLDDLDGCRIGHAQAALELALDGKPVEQPADLRAAAMHDDRLDAGLLQKRDVLGETSRQLRIAHGVASIFDDDDLLIVALHEGQRLRQNHGVGVRADGRLGGL